MKITISGAQGFAGSHLARISIERGFDVECLSRSAAHTPVHGAHYVDVSDGAGGADYARWRRGADVFVHMAGRAHVLRETTKDPRATFWNANVHSTISAAKRAADLGVRRFIFISSIGVHGNSSSLPLTEDSLQRPHAIYAESKLAAEMALAELRGKCDMQIAVVRPPLMYGPGVGANFLRLLRLVDSGFPLPLGMIKNRRSFLGIQNFADFLLHIAMQPDDFETAYIPADNELVSTPELVMLIARHMGRKPRLLQIPDGVLRYGSKLLGKRGLYSQLCESLWVDVDHLRHRTGWRAPFCQDDLLQLTVNSFLAERGRL